MNVSELRECQNAAAHVHQIFKRQLYSAVSLLCRTFHLGLIRNTSGASFSKNLSPLVILSMEKTISEFKSIPRLRFFEKLNPELLMRYPK